MNVQHNKLKSMGVADEITITKLDAAKRQLRTAITLWFNVGDPVAVHTLIYAAHEILYRLFKNKGLSDLVFDTTVIKPEYMTDYRNMLKRDANFFKHANRQGATDPPTTFDTSLNYMFIVMSVSALERMGEALGDEELAVKYWLKCHKPHLFTEEVGNKKTPIKTAEKWRKLSRVEFFQLFMRGRRRRGQ